ncbi:MAG: hypothetical protein ACLQT5_02575 [Steroidobacteraceae bacterium]|jgi:hypothetical protein
MRRHPILALCVLAYIGWGAWQWLAGRPVHPPDGVLAPSEPQQVDVTAHTKRQVSRWTLTAQAHYQVTARVLAVERYRFDALAALIPEDLALGWGPMSDNGVLRSVEISQSNRFYYWHASPNSPISRAEIIEHSANTHVIPDDPLIAAQLSDLRRGQVVTLDGDLVDAVRDDGRWIKTSLVRTDTGAGSCEVMLVKHVTVR